jgi:hypothetical protein
MIAHHPDVDRHGTSHDCGCGCGGTCTCESRCCDLECLIRPNYFCGQTLTDRDLTALVEWARTRFALVRYRVGWGVVCGLDVTCTSADADPCCGHDDKGPAVYVNPGYAIDCCGNDLVVCDPMRVDLSSICVEHGDPCLDLREDTKGTPQDRTSDTDDNKVDEGRDEDDLKRLRQSTDLDACVPWNDRKQLFAVDLMLRYHEDLAHGQRTMFRNKCADAQPCGYSRIVERPCVHLEVTKELRRTVDDREADDWERDYQEELRAYLTELRAMIGRDPADVLRYVREHRPATLCFIEDYVCCIFDSKETRYKEWQNRLLPWLLLDWILQRLRCDCWSCRPDTGVRIGRVLLRRIRVRGGVRCRVVMIDTSRRHRRELQKACRPLRTGAIDLAPYLWQPVNDVRTQLATRGVRVSATPDRTADVLSALTTGLLSADPGREVRPVLMDDPLGVLRVAAFTGVAGNP